MRLLLHPASIVGCSRIRNLMNYIHAWSQATQMPFSLSKCSGVSSPSSCTSWVWVMSQVLHSKLNKISLERGPQGEWTPFTPRTSFKGKCVVGGSFQHEHESLQQFTLTYWTLNIHNILIPHDAAAPSDVSADHCKWDSGASAWDPSWVAADAWCPGGGWPGSSAAVALTPCRRHGL